MTEEKFEDLSEESLRQSMKLLLRDVRALEKMLEEDMFEEGIRRIGAEQELFLVDSGCRPAPINQKVLDDIDDEHFTTELGKYNLEFNADPSEFGDDCLSTLEKHLEQYLEMARTAARKHDAEIVQTGILPTLQKSDLGLDNMTPRARYRALNEAMTELRGSDYEFHIKGIDEFIIEHGNVMLESCNTSFQVHFQVEPDEFAKLYNIAQAVAAPVLAVATNSPVLLGKRLWEETRIALFQQSVDVRSSRSHQRELQPRVSFGSQWVDDSVLEVFREDISRFRMLFGADPNEDPFEAIEEGRPPKLESLCLHNSTVYRWNRPCYGIYNGKPHLRIENRVLPSGPSTVDEIANAAFWFGLMNGVVTEYDDITKYMDFDTAKNNFFSAAQYGLGAELSWLHGEKAPAIEVIREELLPLAEAGLEEGGIDGKDIDRYLGVIRRRIQAERTGADWILTSYNEMEGSHTPMEKMAAVTSSMLTQQRENKPLHEWPLADIEPGDEWRRHYTSVGQYMKTDLFTVNSDEIIDLVACVMDWQSIRHVPVEDHEHRLVGLVTHRALLRLLAEGISVSGDKDTTEIPVRDVMVSDLETVSPDTSLLKAIEIIRESEVSCLPVTEDDDRLVGLLTERDFVDIAEDLLEQRLEDED